MPGRVCIVTGASRGIGRGIALVLARDEGNVVYATARSEASLQALAAEVAAASATGAGGGGVLVPVAVDHTDDDSARGLVERVLRERGVVDLLVNNAYGGVSVLAENFGSMFWEKPVSVFDASHAVGLRSHYVMSALVAPSMVERRSGLIVNVSSSGGRDYLFDVAYGCGKACLDRMGADMAVELKPHGVFVITLWPGAVKTETTEFPGAETVEYSGRAIGALVGRATEEELEHMTGKILQTGELADKFDLCDVDGRRPGRRSQVKIRKAMMTMPPTHWSLESRLATPASNSSAFKENFTKKRGGESKL